MSLTNAWTQLGSKALLTFLALSALQVAAAGSTGADRGRDLFHGDAALTARLTGHSHALPHQAAICSNCHVAGSASPTPSANGSTRSFGPLLTPALLLQSMARRGGPPSRYDEASFCRVLATGVDPAYVMVRRDMPRYDMPAADCRALWVYLSQLR